MLVVLWGHGDREVSKTLGQLSPKELCIVMRMLSAPSSVEATSHMWLSSS